MATSWIRARKAPRVVVAAVTAALAVAVPAVLAAAGVRPWWLLASGVVVAAIGGVFAPVFADSYRRARERGEDRGLALARGSVVCQVREITNPVELGVHPSRHADPQAAATGQADADAAADAVGSSDRVPPYVPRDIHDWLVELLAAGGFVLLVGESTAGKSRAASRRCGPRSAITPSSPRVASRCCPTPSSRPLGCPAACCGWTRPSVSSAPTG